MNNLFVIHTQYNLILSAGLCTTKFAEDVNDLIVFQDFQISDKHRACFNKVFHRVKIFEGDFPKKRLTVKQKLKKIAFDNAEIEKFVCTAYDKLFVVDDVCIQEMYTMKCVKQKNPNVWMSWLEDGANAYFSNGDFAGGMDKTPFRRTIRKYLFSARFGLWGYYDLGDCMGAHKLLRSAYLLFPEQVRDALSQKEKVEISQKAFEMGMEVLFGGAPYTFEENSILIAMDKLEVYGSYFQSVNALISHEVEMAHKKGAKVYFKYHPKETQELPALTGEIELNRTVALESYLTNATTKNMTIIGIKSTSLQTAKKMGFEAVSLIKSVEPNNNAIIKFYHDIEIACK